VTSLKFPRFFKCKLETPYVVSSLWSELLTVNFDCRLSFASDEKLTGAAFYGIRDASTEISG
jgi:hypothetical protein